MFLGAYCFRLEAVVSADAHGTPAGFAIPSARRQGPCDSSAPTCACGDIDASLRFYEALGYERRGRGRADQRVCGFGG